MSIASEITSLAWENITLHECALAEGKRHPVSAFVAETQNKLAPPKRLLADPNASEKNLVFVKRRLVAKLVARRWWKSRRSNIVSRAQTKTSPRSSFLNVLPENTLSTNCSLRHYSISSLASLSVTTLLTHQPSSTSSITSAPRQTIPVNLARLLLPNL